MDDVYAEDVDQLVAQYGRGNIDQLLSVLDGKDLATAKAAVADWRGSPPSQPLSTTVRDSIWSAITKAATEPSKDPSEIVRIVVEDRAHREGRVLRSIPEPWARSTPSTSTVRDHAAGHKSRAAANREEEEDMADGEKRDAFRMKDADIIHFGTDDKGNAYSSENTPKRGDNTKALWAKYRDGMTVAEALAAGLTRSNIRRDRRANNITIEVTAEPEKAEENAAA